VRLAEEVARVTAAAETVTETVGSEAEEAEAGARVVTEAVAVAVVVAVAGSVGGAVTGSSAAGCSIASGSEVSGFVAVAFFSARQDASILWWVSNLKSNYLVE
jgi:hypothetical protein